MSESRDPRPKPRLVETNGGDVGYVEINGPNESTGGPVRSVAALRLLVRERMKLYGTPLPEGFELPPGVTLEDLLKPPPPRPGSV